MRLSSSQGAAVLRHSYSFLLLLAAALGFAAPAQAFDKSGLGDPICFRFFFSAVKFEGGKATGPDSASYSFSGTGQLGGSGRGCGVGGSDKVASYPVTITGSWDGASKRAREVITHKPPPAVALGMVSEIVAQCASDPWTTDASCTLVSQKTTRSDGYNASADIFYEGIVPMSATIIGSGGRKLVASATGPYQKFVLAPTTPPVVLAPLGDQILRRDQPLKVQLQRPADGSPEWYAANKLSFDLEWEVKSNSAGTGKLAIAAPLWQKRTVLPAIDREGDVLTVPNSTLYSGDTSLFMVEGSFNTWRMRARVHDDTFRRPWTSWVVIFSEPPLRVGPMAGPGDKIGGLPPAGKSGAAPAAPAATRLVLPRLPARTNN
jgi:hypothetical protein